MDGYAWCKDEEDTYLLFVNPQLQSYVIDDNDILCESDIFQGLSADDGISGSTAILLESGGLIKDKNLYVTPSNKKKKFKEMTKV